MDDQQWPILIQELREAINNAKDAQDRFQTNNNKYNKTIDDGFKNIQDAIHEIDVLIGQLTELIAVLNNRITELTNNQNPPPVALNAEIDRLTNLLNEAHETQTDAAVTMRDAIDTLKTNNDAMTTSIGKQDVAELNKTMVATTTSLEDIKTRLQELLNKTPPGDLQNNPLTDDTEFKLPNSDKNITYGELKRLVKNKIDKESQNKNGVVPRFYIDLRHVINAVNATQSGIQTAIDKMSFDKNGQLQGGKRRSGKSKSGSRKSGSRKSKSTKKQRKTRRTKTINRKKGYTKRKIARS
jgi:hypothetical protein